MSRKVVGNEIANPCACKLFFADVVLLSRKLTILECAKCSCIWAAGRSGHLVRLGFVPDGEPEGGESRSMT